jgi:hypothetical protein
LELFLRRALYDEQYFKKIQDDPETKLLVDLLADKTATFSFLARKLKEKLVRISVIFQ